MSKLLLFPLKSQRLFFLLHFLCSPPEEKPLSVLTADTKYSLSDSLLLKNVGDPVSQTNAQNLINIKFIQHLHISSVKHKNTKYKFAEVNNVLSNSQSEMYTHQCG